MPQVAHHSSASSSTNARDGVFLAADVGGTFARVGLVHADGARALEVANYKKFACADYPGLGALLREFVESVGAEGVDRGAIACAGYALNGTVINTNLPWTVTLSEVQRQLGFRDLGLVNDFMAVAHAVGSIDQASMTMIVPAIGETMAGPTIVVGPGTGLGAAVRIPSTRGTTVLATEAGQAALTPVTPLEIEILKLLGRSGRHVQNERVLSGPGLATLYGTLAEIRGVRAQFQTPAEITDAALNAGDALALETLDVFCGWLGSTVGDFVLHSGAQGGVHLAGGILPRISDFLVRSTFAERYRDKGSMQPLLERVPVRLIDHGQLGVIGAASWYLSALRDT